MQFQVDFGASQSGVGYQFYDASGVIGSRITAGITNPRTGVYTATATAGGGAIGIYWDCADADFTAQEDLAERLIVEPNVDATITSRMATYTQPTGFLAATFPGAVASTTNITAATGVALTSAYDPAKTAAQAGDAMALTTGERTSTATAVWASATRSLTTFGTLVADVTTAVWSAVTRTLTAASDSSGVTTLLTRIASVLTITTGKVDVNDKTGFELTAAYDAAKTAAQSGSLANVQDDVDDIQASIAGGLILTSAYDAAKTAMQDGGNANIQKINGITITGDGQPGTEFGV